MAAASSDAHCGRKRSRKDSLRSFSRNEKSSSSSSSPLLSFHRSEWVALVSSAKIASPESVSAGARHWLPETAYADTSDARLMREGRPSAAAAAPSATANGQFE